MKNFSLISPDSQFPACKYSVSSEMPVDEVKQEIASKVGNEFESMYGCFPPVSWIHVKEYPSDPTINMIAVEIRITPPTESDTVIVVGLGLTAFPYQITQKTKIPIHHLKHTYMDSTDTPAPIASTVATFTGWDATTGCMVFARPAEGELPCPR